MGRAGRGCIASMPASGAITTVVVQENKRKTSCRVRASTSNTEIQGRLLLLWAPGKNEQPPPENAGSFFRLSAHSSQQRTAACSSFSRARWCGLTIFLQGAFASVGWPFLVCTAVCTVREPPRNTVKRCLLQIHAPRSQLFWAATMLLCWKQPPLKADGVYIAPMTRAEGSPASCLWVKVE